MLTTAYMVRVLLTIIYFIQSLRLMQGIWINWQAGEESWGVPLSIPATTTLMVISTGLSSYAALSQITQPLLRNTELIAMGTFCAWTLIFVIQAWWLRQ